MSGGRAIYVFSIREVVLPYCISDVEYMIPAILHKVYKNDRTFFDEVVNDSMSYYDGGKGDYFSKLAYYNNMADVIIVMLQRLGIENTIKEMLKNHSLEQAAISKINDLVLEFKRQGHE